MLWTLLHYGFLCRWSLGVSAANRTYSFSSHHMELSLVNWEHQEVRCNLDKGVIACRLPSNFLF